MFRGLTQNESAASVSPSRRAANPRMRRSKRRQPGRSVRPQYGCLGILALVLLCFFSIVMIVSLYLLETLDETAAMSPNVASPSNMLRTLGSRFRRKQKMPPTNTYPTVAPKKKTTKSKVHDLLRTGHNLLARQLKNESSIIDMRKLVLALPFDNPDGGAWKQGWNVQPRDDYTHDKPLRVIVVPHSHCDPGWIKTFDQYFQSQTKAILTSVVDALRKDKRRKFIWAEISYFEWWYREQDAEKKQQARDLLANGQLEFVTGGWVQPDEANSELYAMEIQLQEGHDWIQKTFGKKYIPKYGWAIDPFGYSPTMAYLLQRYGLKAMLIQRVHYAVKKELAKRKHLEFYWRQTWDNDGIHDIFTHVMPFFSYDVPHTCGPDPSVCCQFDFHRTSCPWKLPPVPVTSENVEERAMLLLDQYRKKSTLYKSNVVLIPLGDDFRYQTPAEAEKQFTNYQAIFDYVNSNVPNTHIQFGTLSDYFDQVVGSFEAPILKGSFFTYSDVNEDYWSGYFTSRVSDKALDRRLERALFAASSLGASKLELQEPRRTLSLFQHHDGVTGTAKAHVVQDYAMKLMDAISFTEKWITNRINSKYSSSLTGSFDGEVDNCWVSGAPREMPKNLCLSDDSGLTTTAAFYNPLTTSQRCGNTDVPANSLAVAEMPCELPGPAPGSKTKLVFNQETGLLMEPFREEWKVWHVKKGGAYLFFPGQLRSYPLAKNELIVEEGGYVVSTKYWKRKVVEKQVPTEFGDSATVIDFIYEFHLTEDNQEWLVRLNGNIANNGVFYTDLNGYNFDTHHYRADMPIQSQVFPMPTMSSIEDKQYRLTVLSEHAQGTASLQDGGIDVWLDRRLKQDDERGLASGVQDNMETRTRLRVLLERGKFNNREEFSVTKLGQRMWDELQHPLVALGKPKGKDNPVDPADFKRNQEAREKRREKLRRDRDKQRRLQMAEEKTRSLSLLERWERGIFSTDFRRLVHSNPKTKDDTVHRKKVRRSSVNGRDGQSRRHRSHDTMADLGDDLISWGEYEKATVREIGTTKFKVEDTTVPFVFMVYNRLEYLKKAIDSLRKSDFPVNRVPIVISHDGHVSELVQYVESIGNEFKVIQIFHPHSCFEHKTSFPGDDPTLNTGYKGDSFGNPRSPWATCCKHHFTWMLQEVFRLDISNADTFLFLEEDYIVAPTIYRAITSGLNVHEEIEKEVEEGFFGLAMDPTEADTVYEPFFEKDSWYSTSFSSGPMTMNRKVFQKLQAHASEFCTYDDYNWDWSIVYLQNQGLLPRTVLMPSQVLTKHIGIKEGMHTDSESGQNFEAIFPEYSSRLETLDTQFDAQRFTGDPLPKTTTEHEHGFGGWGHPKDQEHCINVLAKKAH